MSKVKLCLVGDSMDGTTAQVNGSQFSVVVLKNDSVINQKLLRKLHFSYIHLFSVNFTKAANRLNSLLYVQALVLGKFKNYGYRLGSSDPLSQKFENEILWNVMPDPPLDVEGSDRV